MKPIISTRIRAWNYQDLMLHRVHEILIVASPYDAYILEEDGRLTEQILHEYLGMQLSYAPRAWQASTATEALAMLSKRKFDLVITMMRISEDPLSFGRQVKEKFPKMPVILLLYDSSELAHLPDPVPTDAIDKTFVWQGNSAVFPVIIKYIEDRKNVKRDVKKGDVRAIIVIEDNPQYYSLILPRIYSEILYHTRKLIDRSLNDTHRMLRLRARPKILLASNYEEAEKYFKKYRANLLGIISDVRFHKNGKLTGDAGYQLTEWVRGIDPTMPILIQSTNPKHEEKVKALKVEFLNKTSKTLLKDLREFIVNNFGFGDFVFRSPKGKEIARASDLLSLQEVLLTVPEESLIFHASSNHFSNWLAARSEFSIASAMRPLQISDFDNVAEMRHYLVESIDKTRKIQRKGRIVEFTKTGFDPASTIMRIGSGSLGGKARGLAFANSLIAKSEFDEKFPEIHIRIPKIAVIGTEEFDEFMEENALWNFALKTNENERIHKRFLKAKFSAELNDSLQKYLENINYPIAVRSSGLLEDAQYQSLAGMYSTVMLPNSAKQISRRLKALRDAIKLVYASTFFQDPKSVLEHSAHRPEEEKMAVVIQEMVGQQYENRFYPNFSGVAQSVNCYPVSYMKRSDGVAYVALGLGKTIVEGGKSLRFSPKYPSILPQFFSPKAILENSQFEFFALEMNASQNLHEIGDEVNLAKLPLSDAEADGTLKHIASVLSTEDNIIRDSLRTIGTRVITFANILKWKTYPLAEILIELLELAERALGCPAEIEFAGNIFTEKSKKSEFCLLQIRPMVTEHFGKSTTLENISSEDIFCRSHLSLGDGVIENIRDIIMVKPENFDTAHTRKIAQEIENFNREINAPFMLIGPGRWGSADPWLGVPVAWNQISNAKIIAEIGMEDLHIDPSFGSHFFQNVTSMHVGYFTVDHKKKADFIDWNWLNSQPAHKETRFLRWIRLDDPILVRIDGQTGLGICTKPQPLEEEIMDEMESTGI